MKKRSLSAFLQRCLDRFFSGGFSALAILAARVLQNANGFLMTAVVAHLYGLDAVGTLTFAAIPITLAALFGTFGLHFRLAQIDTGTRARNTIGLTSAIVSFPVILVLSLLFGYALGDDPAEQFQLAALALSAPFFAQVNVTNALQVLQKKEMYSIIAPGLNTIGILAGALSSDFSMFCLSVCLCRLLGVVVPYALLPHDFGAFRQAFTHLRSGLRYVFSDASLVVSDAAIMLLSAHVLGRSELGILGICRQLLTASDTPGWANLQAVYPKLVIEGEAYFRGFVISMLRLGILLAVLVTGLAIPAGIYVFKVADLWLFAAILMISVPARYMVLSVETRLKAKGAVGFSNRLIGARAFAGFAVIGIATIAGGLLGHVVALAVFFLALAVVEYLLTSPAKQDCLVAAKTGAMP